MPRSTIEYVLSAASFIQYDLENGKVFLPAGNFNQVVLRNPSSSSGDTGASSLWYTTPPSFLGGNGVMAGSPQFSSFFHEMGHNGTLNSPMEYITGGRLDGYANAIYSETMAQIFAHATAYQMINAHTAFGLSDDLSAEIENGASQSMQVVRNSYDHYISSGMSFHSWNDPVTPQDETFDAFMTLAYKFFVHAEEINDYRTPVKRMMFFLGHFNANWQAQYSPNANSTAAETFRSTMMVAAMSYAFQTDLRAEFQALNFPISDTVYTQLFNAVIQP